MINRLYNSSFLYSTLSIFRFLLIEFSHLDMTKSLYVSHNALVNCNVAHPTPPPLPNFRKYLTKTRKNHGKRTWIPQQMTQLYICAKTKSPYHSTVTARPSGRQKHRHISPGTSQAWVTIDWYIIDNTKKFKLYYHIKICF